MLYIALVGDLFCSSGLRGDGLLHYIKVTRSVVVFKHADVRTMDRFCFKSAAGNYNLKKITFE